MSGRRGAGARSSRAQKGRDLPDNSDRGTTRCLIVVKGLQHGGAERIVVAQVTAADGHLVYEVANTDHRRQELAPEITATGTAVHHLGARRPWLIDLWQRLRQAPRIDVVHAHSPLPAVAVRLLRYALPQRRRPGLVTTEHTMAGAYHPLTRLANQLTWRFDDRHIVVSGEVRRAMGSTGRDAQVVIHGIDVARASEPDLDRQEARTRLGVRDGDAVVLVVAALRAAKDHTTLLHAAARLRRGRDDLHVLCAGDGPERDRILALRRSLTLQDHVHLLGHRDDVATLLRAADVLCIASRHEGLPLIVMEAQVAGLPIVATRAGGVPELLEDGVDGRLVPGGDPIALADALAEVLDDPSYRHRSWQRAAQAAVRYDHGEARRTVEAILLEVAGRSGR